MSASKILLVYFLIAFRLCLGQTIYLSDDTNRIFSLDLSTCQTQSQLQLSLTDTLQDLALDAEGNLYSITNTGNLHLINLLTGESEVIHSFLFLQSFEALFIDAQGLIYATGSEGFLYSYNSTFEKEHFLGDIGFFDVQDLISQDGKYYASSYDSQLILVDLVNPSNSQILSDNLGMGPISGLFTFGTDDGKSTCRAPDLFGLSSDGKLISIDLVSQTATVRCSLPLSITGATSTFDPVDFAALRIKEIQTNKSRCGQQDGWMSVAITGGIGEKQLSLNGENFQPDSVFSNLANIEFLLRVKDATGCQVDTIVQIEPTANPTIDSIVTLDPACEGGRGSIRIHAQGNSDLLYSLDGLIFQDSSSFNGLAAGTFIATVQDTNGCIVQSQVALTSGAIFRIEQMIIQHSKCESANGSIEVIINNNRNDLVVHLEDELQSASVITGLSPGNYHLQVSDGASCTIDTNVTVENALCPIFIPDAITPNNDGLNDKFQLFTNDRSEVAIGSYQIFDRWGEIIYTAEDFSIHGTGLWWDGKVNGKLLGNGKYVYLIRIRYEDGTAETLKGHVTVII